MAEQIHFNGGVVIHSPQNLKPLDAERREALSEFLSRVAVRLIVTTLATSLLGGVGIVFSDFDGSVFSNNNDVSVRR